MNLLVIGETCSDQWVHCKVERLNPEAPTPVANPVRTSESFGMAANVRANLLSLGGPAVKVKLLSQDYDIVKTRYVDEVSGYILLRVDENDRAERVNGARLKETLTSEHWDGIVVSSYDKGFLSDTDIEMVGGFAAQEGIPSFLDTKRPLGAFSRQFTVVKINKREYDANVRAGVRPAEHCQNLIVTLGDKGSWWVNGDVTVPVDPVAVSDLAGAGDTMLAALALKYVAEPSIPDAMHYANRAARIAVSKRGVVAVRYEDLL